MVINFEQVHNYYERLVFTAVASQASMHPNYSADNLADVACVMLNRLPARYVRHDVDLMFYLTEKERYHIEESLTEALAYAFEFVGQRMVKQDNVN
ncbi:late competence development ComFB family protein [Rhodoferax sp.]|uniref:late competence development ComFB family protein n=1 Tax=Rhodoferax sp. TaxID=50421 RepID=UPI00262FF8D5|nr:late competence development ComFB family protein [Rhodoferax sp.]MDD5480488.1 late competence development ComFB family protein [Rhodoferax sp.]